MGYGNRKKIDVLWLVEHVAREMDVACAVKCMTRSLHNIDIVIRHIYLDADQIMNEYDPAVIVFPFFYRASDQTIEDFVRIWPGAIFFNLAYEQIYYKAHLKIKAPGDEFTRKKVIHHAWSNFYKDYLLESGVQAEHIFLNGNPTYQLYMHPYNQYYSQRDSLSQKYGLDSASRWIFIPENYRWAFVPQSKINQCANEGGDLGEFMKMREFCRESLSNLLQWCNEAARDRNLEIIIRPRPATMLQHIEKFFARHVGRREKNLHFIKGDSVREWILASDVVVSSISTSLIEAAVANKPIYIAEPIPIPESLYCDWYGYVSRIHSGSEFGEMCETEKYPDTSTLGLWAQNEMMANGDPLKGLADFVGKLVEKRSVWNPTGAGTASSDSTSVRTLSQRAEEKRSHWTIGSAKRIMKLKLPPGRFVDRAKSAFGLFIEAFKKQDTHEADIFTEADVQSRVEAWSKVFARK